MNIKFTLFHLNEGIKFYTVLKLFCPQASCYDGREAQQDMCNNGLLEVCCLAWEFTDLPGSLVLDFIRSPVCKTYMLHLTNFRSTEDLFPFVSLVWLLFQVCFFIFFLYLCNVIYLTNTIWEKEVRFTAEK